MVDTKDIKAFLSEHDYDVRRSGNGRWMDQKCTFDVLCFVSEQITSFVEVTGCGEFTNRDIWRSEAAIVAVQQDFVKPNPLGEPSHDEYNKFYRQPMKMLSAAGVLSERRDGNSIIFSIRDREMLDFISQREANALQFLTLYIEKTLRDSGLWHSFTTFFQHQDQASLNALKEEFKEFEFTYTPIGNKNEAYRIFSKVLNPLAFYQRSKGIVRGGLSKTIITKSDLAYNRPNWRDELVGKDKSVARREYVPPECPDAQLDRLVRAVTNDVKRMNDKVRGGKSEVLDWDAAAHKASHAHHMFPRAVAPDIAAVPENIIMLTASQHLDSAHPDGDTSVIDLAYQGTCLYAKLNTIEEFGLSPLEEVRAFYSFERFAHMLDKGFATDFFSEMPLIDKGSLEAGIELFCPIA